MTGDPMNERAAQDLTGDGETAEEFVARSNHLVACHH